MPTKQKQDFAEMFTGCSTQRGRWRKMAWNSLNTFPIVHELCTIHLIQLKGGIMMKIAVIAPGALPEEAKTAMKADMLTYAEPGTTLEIFAVEEGKIAVAADLDLKAPSTVALAQKIENQGFDAIILDGT